MRLGEFIKTLEGFDGNDEVEFDSGDAPRHFDSWRGVYAELTLTRGGKKPMKVSELLRQARAAVGGTFEGYKGGDYQMDESTPVWADDYGDCAYNGIVGVRQEPTRVVIVTADLSAYRGW